MLCMKRQRNVHHVLRMPMLSSETHGCAERCQSMISCDFRSRIYAYSGNLPVPCMVDLLSCIRGEMPCRTTLNRLGPRGKLHESNFNHLAILNVAAFVAVLSQSAIRVIFKREQYFRSYHISIRVDLGNAGVLSQSLSTRVENRLKEERKASL